MCYAFRSHQSRQRIEVELVRVLLLIALQVSAGSVPPGAQECHGADWHAPAAVDLPKKRVLQVHMCCSGGLHMHIMQAQGYEDTSNACTILRRPNYSVASLTSACPVVDAPTRRTGRAVRMQHGGSCQLDVPLPGSTAAAVAHGALPANEHTRLAEPSATSSQQSILRPHQALSSAEQVQQSCVAALPGVSAAEQDCNRLSHSQDMHSHLQDAVHEAGVAQVVQATQPLWQAVCGFSWHGRWHCSGAIRPSSGAGRRMIAGNVPMTTLQSCSTHLRSMETLEYRKVRLCHIGRASEHSCKATVLRQPCLLTAVRSWRYAGMQSC